MPFHNGSVKSEAQPSASTIKAILHITILVPNAIFHVIFRVVPNVAFTIPLNVVLHMVLDRIIHAVFWVHLKVFGIRYTHPSEKGHLLCVRYQLIIFFPLGRILLDKVLSMSVRSKLPKVLVTDRCLSLTALPFLTTQSQTK